MQLQVKVDFLAKSRIPFYFVPLLAESAAHEKFAASSVLPVPFHFATFGNATQRACAIDLSIGDV